MSLCQGDGGFPMSADDINKSVLAHSVIPNGTSLWTSEYTVIKDYSGTTGRYNLVGETFLSNWWSYIGRFTPLPWIISSFH